MLARELGKTVAELDAQLGENELIHWRAYLSRRPAREFSSWNQIACLLKWFLSSHVKPESRHLISGMVQASLPDFDL